MNNTIGVIGCGWLGLPLATAFVKEGCTVHGTTTTPHKLEALVGRGIRAFKVGINEDQIEGQIHEFLTDVTTLVVNVPPKLRKGNGESFIKKMTLLLHEAQTAKIRHLLFVSSTSVYGATEGIITENTPTRPLTLSAQQLLASEQLFMKSVLFKTTIVRFGGLIGANRHPVKHLEGKTLTNGDELINLIHLDDCIHMIKTIVEKEYWNEVFNGVYPHHPQKKVYYTQEAVKARLTPPTYIESKKTALKKTIVSQNFFVKKHFLHTSIVS
ncbi:MAG: NAD-dependent epimerase/dehydratase family protein [Bacteroidota bacterium]